MRVSNFSYFSKPIKPDYDYSNPAKTQRYKPEPEKQYPNPNLTRTRPEPDPNPTRTLLPDFITKHGLKGSVRPCFAFLSGHNDKMLFLDDSCFNLANHGSSIQSGFKTGKIAQYEIAA